MQCRVPKSGGPLVLEGGNSGGRGCECEHASAFTGAPRYDLGFNSSPYAASVDHAHRRYGAGKGQGSGYNDGVIRFSDSASRLEGAPRATLSLVGSNAGVDLGQGGHLHDCIA